MGKIQEVRLGKFDITSGKAHISDPCYDMGTWCAGTIQPVKNGEWCAEVIKSDEGDWGNRCAVLMAHHADHPVGYEDSRFEKQRFEVGVDSGQAGIYDLKAFKGGEDGGEYGEGGWYDANCQLTIGDISAGILPDRNGVVSSSGFGDGGYRCSAIRDDENKIIAIKIDFGVLGGVDDEEDYEACEDCGCELAYGLTGLCPDCEEAVEAEAEKEDA